MAWSVNDKRFLRSLRIEADDDPPPMPPMPRFLAMPTALTGWYRVVDSVRRRPMLDFGPDNSKDPRADAEDSARKMNERYEASRAHRQQQREDDGA